MNFTKLCSFRGGLDKGFYGNNIRLTILEEGTKEKFSEVPINYNVNAVFYEI